MLLCFFLFVTADNRLIALLGGCFSADIVQNPREYIQYSLRFLTSSAKKHLTDQHNTRLSTVTLFEMLLRCEMFFVNNSRILPFRRSVFLQIFLRDGLFFFGNICYSIG